MPRHAAFLVLPFLVVLILDLQLLAASRPSILLLTLSSTRADRMGFLGAKTPTPHLNALAKQSIVFERAYAQAPLTLVSHATILSGTYAQTHHMSELGASLPEALPYLPVILHQRGYHTAAFVSSILLDPQNGPAGGFDRGFDIYDAGFRPFLADARGAPVTGRNAAETISRAIAWLKQNSRAPFFVWIHLSDPARVERGLYDRALARLDAAVGQLVLFLRAAALADGTVIVVAADHGEGLGAHGEQTHGIFVYDETVRVPLTIKLSQNRMAGTRIPARVRLLDIAPTLLEIAGISVPPAMQGQSLLRIAKENPDADQPVYTRTDLPDQGFGWSPIESWRAGKYLYIRAPKPELYNLSSDPGATHNLAATAEAIAQTMGAQLASFDSHFENGMKANSARLSASEIEKLASLGYVGLEKREAGRALSGTDPKDEIALANQTLSAMRELEEGRRTDALDALRQVLHQNPNLYAAQYGLGVALAEQGQYKEAIPHLHQAVELRPESAFAQYEIGATLLREENFKTAAIHLEIASSRLPEFAPAHLALADAYQHLGRQTDAARERARVREPLCR